MIATKDRLFDPLLDIINAVSPDSTDYFPLRLLADQVIELSVRFPGGNFTTFGRVSLVEATPCFWIDKCRLPIDAEIRRQSAGPGFVYESTR